ncbi:BA75_02262T0 [Komagataella pastoris]|uniref:BA75_02262T0 n=1 Tax=Komagataella pastoris TaxID=4922 RepID=A0A1B2JCV6_PICPA|nr:BA75_02262T0 [Komagataella pastoris]
MKAKNEPCFYSRQRFSTSLLNSQENSDDIEGLVEDIIHNAQIEVQRQNERSSKREHDSLLDDTASLSVPDSNKKHRVNGLIDAINLFQRSLVETTEEEITDSHETERNKGALGLIDSENDTKDTCICQNNHTVIFQDIDSLPTLKNEAFRNKALLHKKLVLNDSSLQTNDSLIYLGSKFCHYLVSFKLNELHPSLNAELLDCAVQEVLHFNNVHTWALRLNFGELLESKFPGKQFRPKILAECFMAYIAALKIETGSDNNLLILLTQWILKLASEKIYKLRVENLIDRSAKDSLHKLMGPIRYNTASNGSKFISKCLNNRGEVIGHGSAYSKTDSELRSAMHALSSAACQK